MTGLILLALLNGVLIAASRSINGRLGLSIGALYSSFWNHLGGFLLLTALLIAAGVPGLDTALEAPLPAYFGGALGALFVAVNSSVLPRLGAVTTLMLIIAGQMSAGMAIDHLGRGMLPAPAQLVAIAPIVLGTTLTRTSVLRRWTPPATPDADTRHRI